jgi:hypothetical protein
MEQQSTTDLTTDGLEQQLIELESLKARIYARQISLRREADHRQIPLGDGCRSLGEWVAGRLDVAPETAKALVAAARVLETIPELEETLGSGLGSFDRIIATAHLAAVGASPERINQSAGLDISGIRKLAAAHRRMTPTAEQQTFRDRFVSMQPTLDRTSYRLWGQLPGVDGQLVEQALLTKADSFPTLPDGTRGNLGQRNADALVSISQDSLTTTTGDQNNNSSGPVLSVFTDGQLAAESEGETGSVTATGISVGQSTLEEIFCTGSTEHLTLHNGQPLTAGRTSRIIPPKLRRAILHRDGGCGADGCTSRYRLQPHHRVPWSQGGRTDPDNLTTLCCRIRHLRPSRQETLTEMTKSSFHHHVVIHQLGYTIQPHTPPGRLRFHKPPGHDPP